MITGGTKTGAAFLPFFPFDLLFVEEAFVILEFFEVVVLVEAREEMGLADRGFSFSVSCLAAFVSSL